MPINDASLDARLAIDQFTAAGIELPASVGAAYQRHRDLLGQPPPADDPRETAQLLADGAAPDRVDDAIRRHLTHQFHRTSWTQALLITGARVLAAIRDARDEIHGPLKAEADTAIAGMVAAAELAPATLGELLRDGRRDDATILAAFETNAARYEQLSGLRDQWLVRPGERFNPNLDCRRWPDPTRVQAVLSDAATPLENLQRAVAKGQHPWFPSVDEAIDAAQRITERTRTREAEQTLHRAQHPVPPGGAAFGY